MSIPREDFDTAKDFLKNLTPQEKHDLAQHAVTDDELNGFIESQAKYLLQQYRDDPKHEQLMMIEMIARPMPAKPFSKTLMVIADGWPEDTDTKTQVQLGLGVKYAEDDKKANLVALTFLGEGYQIEEDKRKASGKDWIKDIPGRKEIAFIHATTIDGRSCYRSWELLRDEKNLVREVVQLADQPYKFPPEKGTGYQMYAFQRILAGYSMVRKKQFVEG